MKERWLPVGILAGTLFAVNLVARLVVRLTAGKDDGKQTWIGLIALLAVAVVVLLAATRWVRLYPLPRAVGDLVVAVLVGAVLSTLIGPFISKGEAFGGGVGYVLAQWFYYVAVSGIGGLFGATGVMAAGLDYKAQSWKRYEETVRARPRRVVRR